MVGRNDPCPCGSGKKYKKCCAMKEELPNDMLASEEIERVIEGYFESVFQSSSVINEFEKYKRNWMKSLAGVENTDSWENVVLEAYLFLEREDAWNRYLLKWLNGPIRPRTRELLESWREPVVLLGKVTGVSGELVSVEQVLEHVTYEFQKNPDLNPRVGGTVFGFALPDDRLSGRGIEFISGFDYVLNEGGQLEREIEALAEASGLSTSREFYRKHVADLYKLIMEWAGVPVSERLSVEQRIAYDLLLYELNALGVDDMTLEFAEGLFVSYYIAKTPTVRKHEGVAAAVFLLLYELFMLGDAYFTQAGIAKLFGVSVSSMKKHMDPLYELLEEAERQSGQAAPEFAYYVGTLPRATERANWEMYCISERQMFDSIEEMQQFFSSHMNDPFIPETPEEKAQMLCYEAYEGIKDYVKVRAKATEAQEIDPVNVDSALLLAHTALSFEEAERHLKKAVQYGKKTFDPSVDNTWFLVTNRPYLRGLLTYGVTLYEEGKYIEAANYLEQLLKLNPDDNQGARYLTISTYLKSGELRKAKKLLDRYVPMETNDATHAFLLWQYEYMLAKKSWPPKVEQAFEDALAQNPFVEVLQKEDMPKLGYPRHLDVETGSIDEAMYIWSLI